MPKLQPRIGGREATKGVIPGRYSLSVGLPNKQPSAGWEWKKLTDLARLESGHTPSRRYPEYWGGTIPWLGIKDARRHHGRVILKTNECATELGIENSAARLLPASTVCLSRTASIGYITRLGTPMATSQDFVNWVCGENLDPVFLTYILLSEVSSFQYFAHGTTHQTIYFPEVKAFHVCVPNIDEQKRIAAVLGALDDKIENNRKMNETLESMAQAIFKSWFVDFDPVIDNALCAGNPIPSDLEHKAARRREVMARDDYKKQPYAHLFPDHFVDSDLGSIPAGWLNKGLLEQAELISGGTPKTKVAEYWNGSVAWASAKDVSQCGETFLIENERNISELGLNNSSAKLVPKFATAVVARGATTGRLCMFGREMAMNQTCYALNCSANPFWFYCHFKKSVPIIVNHAHGSVFDTITTRTLKSFSANDPTQALKDKFEENVAPVFEKLLLNQEESRTLASLRDTLLPKLISGEIRVPEIESLVEEALI